MEYNITQIQVGSHRVGMIGLKKVFIEVQSLNLSEPEKIMNEIINRTKRSNYIPIEAESEYAEALLLEYRRFLGEQIEEKRGVIEIRILGPGCPRCEELVNHVMTAVAELELPADVQHIRDLKQIANYGPVSTPALVINGVINVMGKVPSVEQLKRMMV